MTWRGISVTSGDCEGTLIVQQGQAPSGSPTGARRARPRAVLLPTGQAHASKNTDATRMRASRTVDIYASPTFVTERLEQERPPGASSN